MTVSPDVQERTVACGSDIVRYRLSYAARETLQIRVRPDREVAVLAPIGRTPEEVDDKIRSRAGWIRQQLRDLDLYYPLPQPRRFVSGETHWFFGRQYRLRVVDGHDAVQPKRPFLIVATREPDNAPRTGELLEAWYRQQAAEAFPKRLRQCMRSARTLVDRAPRLQVRKMSRRWGSCSPSGTITLNVDLVKASSLCIDYVIMHELCHLKVMNHGAEFYTLLSRYMPDWEQRRRRLNETGR